MPSTRRENRPLLRDLVTGVAIFASTLYFASIPAPSLSAQAGFSDHGTFVLKLAGRQYGSETFSINSTENKITAESTSELRESTGGELIRMVSKLVLDGQLEPLSYAWSANRPEKFDLTVDFTGRRAKSQLRRPGTKDDVREIQLPKNVLILDNNITVHYQILIDKFLEAGGGKQNFQAYIPQQATPGALTVQDAGMETIELAGGKSPLRHLVVLSDNAQIDLWVDAQNRLQRLYWSAPQIEALRK